jgi:phosphoribosylformylglycinamidine cyclo-ligase
MCVNDLVVANAEPLFFLDYYATSQLDVDVAATVVESIANACLLANCTLAGGETAEMPGMYHPGDYDLAGFCVGVAEEAALIHGDQVAHGHLAIGLPSSGPHSNGYSLIRRIFQHAAVEPETHPLTSNTRLLDAVMTPTRIYVTSVRAAMATGLVTGAVHVTGGGFQENLPRVFDDTLSCRIDLDAWARPEIFRWLEQAGDVGAIEMLKTFNCGIGFILFVPPEHADTVMQVLREHDEDPKVIGEMIPRHDAPVVFTGAFE